MTTTGGDKILNAMLGDGVDTATSARIQKSCTASATPHAGDGTLVEVDPSLSADADGILFALTTATFTAATNTSTILEIYTGASTVEVLWARVLVGYRHIVDGVSGVPTFIPGFLAAGTRVTVRARSAVASKVVNGVYQFISANRSVDWKAPDTYGINTSTSQGVTLTPPGSLNVKGAWTEIAASTTKAITSIGVTFQGAGGNGMNASGVSIDIGTGANPSEVAIISDIVTSTNASEYYAPRGPVAYAVNIPAGTRIVARYSRANAANAVDLVLVGA